MENSYSSLLGKLSSLIISGQFNYSNSPCSDAKNNNYWDDYFGPLSLKNKVELLRPNGELSAAPLASVVGAQGVGWLGVSKLRPGHGPRQRRPLHSDVGLVRRYSAVECGICVANRASSAGPARPCCGQGRNSGPFRPARRAGRAGTRGRSGRAVVGAGVILGAAPAGTWRA